jgi:hypothetical protein
MYHKHKKNRGNQEVWKQNCCFVAEVADARRAGGDDISPLSMATDKSMSQPIGRVRQFYRDAVNYHPKPPTAPSICRKHGGFDLVSHLLLEYFSGEKSIDIRKAFTLSRKAFLRSYKEGQTPLVCCIHRRIMAKKDRRSATSQVKRAPLNRTSRFYVQTSELKHFGDTRGVIHQGPGRRESCRCCQWTWWINQPALSKPI